MRLLCSIVLILFFATTVFSQPNPRHLEEVAYDKIRNRLILFGGAELVNGRPEEPSMVYEWDGTNWKRLESPGPQGRRGHGWIYDENRKETILIGGVTEGKVLKDSVVFDVWSWNGSSWKLHTTNCPVKEPETVYDPVNKRILVYGDANNKTAINYNAATAFELWEYKSGKWKKLSDAGPSIISSRMIAFDSERNRLVIPVFDQQQMIVWEWTGQVWEKIVCENNCPVYRTRFALAYDQVEKETFLFGGLTQERSQSGDFWKWNGKRWDSIENQRTSLCKKTQHILLSARNN
ncbi:MAG: hypothetical protein WDO71_06690 [Bacteroidota bacterium]